MTEQEWGTATDPGPMLKYLRGKAGERKLRLFAIARCRHFWHEMEDERLHRAVTVAERYAEGMAPDLEIGAACEIAECAFQDACSHEANLTLEQLQLGSEQVIRAVYVACTCEPQGDDNLDGRRNGYDPPYPTHDAHIIRDIFGNPFRPVTADPSWLTPTVTALAEAIYAERAFDRLPILADALEEAGCDLRDVLAHCRDDGPHVRGCWVVDLVLGKA